MKPNIDILAFLIGFIAGTIYYIDGWAPSTNKDFKKNRRYRGLAILIGGGIITPLLDHIVLEDEKFTFFIGYLFGTTVGWLTLLVLGLFLYVTWRNTKDNRSNRLYGFGQVCYSILEFIYLGIAENPHLIRERSQQLEVDKVKGEAKIDELKEKLKRENPKEYIELTAQEIDLDRIGLEERTKKLESLRNSVSDSENSPETEAQKTIDYQEKVIKTLKNELALVEEKYRNDRHENLENAFNFYKSRLEKKELEKRELEEDLKQFRNNKISKDDFIKRLQYQRINQLESGGIVLGKIEYNQIDITFYSGNITNLKTDVIVSSDDNYLTMGGGVSMAINQASGNQVYTEAQIKAPIDFGDVVSTRAGKLPVKAVYHGAVIDIDNRIKPNADVIRKVVRKSLLKTQRDRYKSIAFPLLGTGTGRYSIFNAIEIMLKEIIETIQQEQIVLLEIIIVMYGKTAERVDVNDIIRKVNEKTLHNIVYKQ